MLMRGLNHGNKPWEKKMNYNIKIETTKDARCPAREAVVEGLLSTDIFGEDCRTLLHFAHHTFDIVWNEVERRQVTVNGVNKFFGGMGEGSTFSTWQQAILSSLYDLYQVSDNLKDGDTFTATYLGETATFICDGVHVVRATSPSVTKDVAGWLKRPSEAITPDENTEVGDDDWWDYIAPRE